MKCEPTETDAVSEQEEQPESPSSPAPKTANRPFSVARLLHTRINLKRIVINVSDTQYPVISEVAEELEWKIQTKADAGDWDVFWTDSAVLPQILFRMHFFQKINHYPGIHILARKNLLGLSLMGMRQKFPSQYNFFPLTWMLPSQYTEFRRYFESVQRGRTRTYIVKPEADCQGRGIFLTRNIEDVLNGNHYVVQKYMTRPFLLEGLKFDFRIYVLLAGTEPLRVYLYDQGLVRLATQPYRQPTQLNMTDMCMHLTNYAINKMNPNFVFNTSEKNMGVGHKRSLSFVLGQLEKAGHDVVGMKQKMKDIVIKTLLTGMPLIAHQYRYCQPEEYSGNMCFHILGLDIMLTDKFEPILLEVNHTPSFTTDTPLDHHIKSKLIKDTLVLMNINIEMKKQLFQKAKECNSERLYTGKRRIFQGKDKEEEIQKSQQQRDEYQQANMGGYERIHPTSDPELNKKYQMLLAHARKLFVEESSTRNRSLKEPRSKPPTPTNAKVTVVDTRTGSSEKMINGLNIITGIKHKVELASMNAAVSMFSKKPAQKVCSHINFGESQPNLESIRSKESKNRSANQPRQRVLTRSTDRPHVPTNRSHAPTNRSSTQQRVPPARNIAITSVEAQKIPELQHLRLEQFRLSRNRFGNFLQPKIYDLNKQQEEQSASNNVAFTNNGAMALSIRYQRSMVRRPSVSRIKEYLQKKLQMNEQYQ